MSDACWMAAQLLLECAQAKEGKPLKPLPQTAEVQAIAARQSPQPTRTVSSPAGWAPSELLTNAASALPWPDFNVSEPLAALSAPFFLGTLGEMSRGEAPAPQPLGDTQLGASSELVMAAASIRALRPRSGSQLYQQRWSALRSGQLYTRIAPESFSSQWQGATQQPTYDQWRQLLAQEAQAVQTGQGQNRLTVMVGDSLSMWLPQESLPRDQFWLNQGISGDTTAGILKRLDTFAATRPTTIHVMAGINDLKNGASDVEVVSNLRQIMQQLRQQHPQARVVIHSILPTRWPQLSSQRIRRVNRYVAHVASQQEVEFLDLQTAFADDQGDLRADYTTDGLHLSHRGYQLWHTALRSI